MRALFLAGSLLVCVPAAAESVASLTRAKELAAQQPDKHVLVYYKTESR